MMLHHLHFNNNHKINNIDRSYKIWSLIDYLSRLFHKLDVLDLEEHLSVDD